MNRVLYSSLVILSCALPVSTPYADQADVLIIGGTPGGIASAVAAARAGRTVIVIEYHEHIGGMMTSGLGKSDVENRAMIGGLFKEFIHRVLTHYVKTYGKDHENVKLCRGGYYYEPSVAESVLEGMLHEQDTITVLKGWRLVSAHVTDHRLTAVTVANRRTRETRKLPGKVFIDATYEGDLYAAAGAEFTALDVEGALASINAVSRAVGSFFERYDAILLPALRHEPLKLGYLNQNDPSLSARDWYDRIFDVVPYTAPFNMTGTPAITVPAGMHNSMPVPIQIGARYGDESTLFKLAAFLEQAQPWSSARPAVLAGD